MNSTELGWRCEVVDPTVAAGAGDAAADGRAPAAHAWQAAVAAALELLAARGGSRVWIAVEGEPVARAYAALDPDGQFDLAETRRLLVAADPVELAADR